MFWRVITTMSFVLLVAMVLVQPTQAQQRAPQEADVINNDNVESDNIIADLALRNATILEQNDHTLIVAFDLLNEDSYVQPQIKYSIQLIAKDNNQKQYVFDQNIFEESITLAPHEKQHREVHYDIPQYIAGQYEVTLFASNEKDLPLAIAHLGAITLNGNAAHIALKNQTCAMRVADESQTYGIDYGIDIAPEEKLSVVCDIENSYKEDVSFTVKYTSFIRSAFGKKIDTFVQKNYEKISAQKTQQMSFVVPTKKKPQVYAVKMVLVDRSGKEISNTILLRYTVQGNSATVQNIRLDKTSYNVGDTAHVIIATSTSVDIFPGSRSSKEGESRSLKIRASLKDSDGSSCAKDIVKKYQETTGATNMKLDFTIIKQCQKPRVIVSITTPDDNVLDTSTVNITNNNAIASMNNEEKDGGTSSLSIIVIILIVTVILILGILFFRKKQSLHLFIFFSAMAGVLLTSGGVVHAKTFSFGGEGFIQYYGYYDVDNSQCGSVTGTADAGVYICNNRIVDVDVNWHESSSNKNNSHDLASTRCKQDGHNVKHCKTSRKQDTRNVSSGNHTAYFFYTWDWEPGGSTTYDRSKTESESYTVNACTITGTIHANVTRCAKEGQSGVANVWVDKISGTATGTTKYRFRCGAQPWTSWKSGGTKPNAHECTFNTPGNKTLRVQVQKGSTITTLRKVVTIKACSSDGVCGSAVNKTYASVTELNNDPNRCSTGTPSALSGTGPWSWTCSGVNGGNDSSTCIAQPASPQVGPDCNKTNLTSTPTQLCTKGSLTTPPGLEGSGSQDDPWKWSCTLGSQVSEICSAQYQTPTCGTASGTQRAAKPTTNLCATGTPSTLTYDAAAHKWTWTCVLGSQTSSTCSTTRGCTDPNALICGNTCMPPVTFSSQVNLRRGGGADPAKVNVPQGIYCDLDGDGNRESTNGTFDLPVTSHPFVVNQQCGCDGGTRTTAENCIGGVKPNGDACDDDNPRALNGTIQCVCTAKKCSQAGTCVATPVFASSYSSSACASNCSSNADCSSGSIRETN